MAAVLEEPPLLRVHSLWDGSYVNGPGRRFVVWTQGCTKACPGCFNPSTWSSEHPRSEDFEAEVLAERIKESECEGLTLSGGDPLEQPEALLGLFLALQQKNVLLPRGIILFTGYTWDEIKARSFAFECVEYCDLVIDGRFDWRERQSTGLAGSTNQQYHYHPGEGRGKALVGEAPVFDQGVEIRAAEEGSLVQVTGFPQFDRSLLQRFGLRVVTPS